MSKRARAIGEEHYATETQMEALNESVRRDDARIAKSIEIARERYASDLDVEFPTGATAESRDGGYWIRAQVWVDLFDVEEALEREEKAVVARV